MKKTLVLLSSLLILIGLGIFATRLLSKKGKSDEKIADFNFEIKDTSSIDAITITEPSGQKIALVRNGKKWEPQDGGCVQQHLVTNVLDAAFNIRFKGYVPERAVPNVMKTMATIGTQVDFYSEGDRIKTWYIGTSTPDHYGTYMLVDTEESGKSDLPVIMEIKGVKGIIGPRFFADPRRWSCTEIFHLEIAQIQKVAVQFSEKKQRNFTVTKSGGKFSVTNNGNKLNYIDTNMVFRYLHNYKKIHFDVPNFDLSKKQVDSVKRSQPFCTLTVTKTTGKPMRLRMFRAKSETGNETIDDFGEKVTHDVNRFWCELPNGTLVKCQYFVFNPLIMGHIYFSYIKNPTTEMR